jgi:hypothetical protein
MAQSLWHERDEPDPVGRCSDAELLTVGTYSFTVLKMHVLINIKMLSSLRPVPQLSPRCMPIFTCWRILRDILWLALVSTPFGNSRATQFSECSSYTTWHDRSMRFSKLELRMMVVTATGLFFLSLCSFCGENVVRGWGTNSQVPPGIAAPFYSCSQPRERSVWTASPCQDDRGGEAVGESREFHPHRFAFSPRQPRGCTARAQHRTPTCVRPNTLREVSFTHRFSSAPK